MKNSEFGIITLLGNVYVYWAKSLPVYKLGLVYDELFLKRFRTKMYRTKTEKQEPLVCT